MSLSNNISHVKSISYGGIIPYGFLWQKAFLLIPIWAVAFIPLLGFFCRAFGNIPTQLGFGLVLCTSALYFMEDLLKRKITFDDENLYFGFRVFSLKSIQDVEVKYKKGKFLPTDLLLNCNDGRRLKLKLAGLSGAAIERLMKQLQSRNSTVKTAPVLNTFVKCRTAKRKTFDLSDKLELPYNGRKFIFESVDVFLSTAAKWARVGPVLTCILVAPIWMHAVNGLYSCLEVRTFTSPQSELNLYLFLTRLSESLLTELGKHVNTGVGAVAKIAENSFVTFATATIVVAFFAYLLRFIWQPNAIVADKKGIKLVLRLGECSITLKAVAWDNIESVALQKSSSSAGILRIKTKRGRNFEVDLSLIEIEDRSLLLKRIEKFLPTNQIDPELSHAMLAKSERSYTEIWLQSLSQAPERKTLEPLEPGQVVGDGRFEVLRSVGIGGQGKAYLCRPLDSESGQLAVLKETIMPIFADGNVRRKALENFEKEASLLKSIDDDGVVKLLDYFVEDHRAYLVLEHIDGSNLRDLVLNEGVLDEEKIKDLALQMCCILKTLHAKSIIHRDFTPDNLILNSRGQLKLIDFNVAQQLQSTSSATIVGKHAYLPPEQFRGKATEQSDLYALGATLFFLVSGCDPEPISESSPHSSKVVCSEAFDALVRKATALKLSSRFQSAQEVEDALIGGNFEMPPSAVPIDIAQKQKEVSAHG